jgi:hypothetical protein
MIEERDELIERAVRALSPLPPVKAGAVARVLMAVRANRLRPKPLWRRLFALNWMDGSAVPVQVTGLLVAASLIIGVVAQRTFGGDEEFAPADSGNQVALQPVNLSAERGVPVAFGLQLANAKSVSVVGDFNGWDPSAAPMERVGGTGAWSATVLAKPGRHVYAFMVDGATLMADPRAPRARSADFGGDASVLMVRTP